MTATIHTNLEAVSRCARCRYPKSEDDLCPDCRACPDCGCPLNCGDPESLRQVHGGNGTWNRGWDDPDVRHRRIEGMKRAWADPDVRGRRIMAVKLSMARPEVRQRMSEARKRIAADPNVRLRRIQAQRRRHDRERQEKRGTLLP